MTWHLKVLKSLKDTPVRKVDEPGVHPEYAVVAADVGTGEGLPLLGLAETRVPVGSHGRLASTGRRSVACPVAAAPGQVNGTFQRAAAFTRSLPVPPWIDLLELRGGPDLRRPSSRTPAESERKA